MAAPVAILHATAVAFANEGLILKGKSGSGKTTLAWQMIGLGATLVCDDGLLVEAKEGRLWMDSPDAIHGKIEARNFGILSTPAAPAWARAVVDMDVVSTTRLPEPQRTEIAGVTLPLFHRVESPAFPVMLRSYLESGSVNDIRHT